MYRRILRFIFLTILGLMTTLFVPILLAQGFPGNNYAAAQSTRPSEAIAPTSNSQTLLQQGIELYNAERFSEAIGVFQQAFANSRGDNLNQALVMRYLSLAYQHLGQWEEAEKAILQSRQLLENQKNTTNTQVNTQAYLDVLAKIWNTQGRLQWARGHWSEALESWKQAEASYQKAGNRAGVIGSLINEITALQWLGLSRQALAGLSHQPLVEFPNVDQVIKQIEQIIQQESDPNLKASQWQSLGEALRRIGKLSMSETFLQKSLQVAQEFQLNKAANSALLELGNTKRALANRAIVINKQQRAKDDIRDAIKYYQQAAASSSFRLQAQLNLFSLWVETGEWLEAVKLQPQIQQSLASLPASTTNVYARLNFARNLTCLLPDIDKNSVLWLSCAHLNQLREHPSKPSEEITAPPSSQEIEQIIATALPQTRSLKDRKAESYALGQLGELYELTGNSSKAQNLTQQALLLAEEIQAPDVRYRWEWQLGRLWEKQGDRQRAIASYKNAFNSLKFVRNDLLTIDTDVQFSFRENVEPIHRQLVDLLLRSEDNSKLNPELNPELNPVNFKDAIYAIDSLQLAELENFLNCNLSQIVRLKLDDDKDLKAKLDKLDPNTAFIYPIILEDRLEVILSLPNQQKWIKYTTSINRSQLELTLNQLRGYLTQRDSGRDEYEPLSGQLYDWLIRPAEKYLNSDQIKTLVFVSDGSLRDIPMSALWDGKQFLAQKYAVTITPALQLLGPKPLEKKQFKALIGGLTRGSTFSIEGSTFNFKPLPNVKNEVEKIKQILPNSEEMLDEQFQTKNLQSKLYSSSYPIVHLATHGHFSSNPQETFILSAPNVPINLNQLQELLQTRKQSRTDAIELLVLSACQTATGDKRAALGLAGVAVRAGAFSTLASLWSVNDRSTALFMGQFYEHLVKQQMTKAEALRQTQLDLLQNGKGEYRHPFYWSPFVLIGDWL
ncbi:MAG: CHAT domain-containing protein [Scytonema sp. RU_4_4]|nr:CHAT domain-containing protein [Scytonema sp. RU_4_4]